MGRYEVRPVLCPGLSFSRRDRDTNVQRVAFVARLLASNGVAVLVAAISPTASRGRLRAAVEETGCLFIEVCVSAELAALARRDPKGLYRRALAGEIPHFTGVSDPYEAPADPDVVVDLSRVGGPDAGERRSAKQAADLLGGHTRTAVHPPDQ